MSDEQQQRDIMVARLKLESVKLQLAEIAAEAAPGSTERKRVLEILDEFMEATGLLSKYDDETIADVISE